MRRSIATGRCFTAMQPLSANWERPATSKSTRRCTARPRQAKNASGRRWSHPDPPVTRHQAGSILVPILRHEDSYLGSEQARLLQGSSVPLESDKPLPTPKTAVLAKAGKPAAKSTRPGVVAADSGYRAGLVFAIDATLSMDPDIDRTREAVMKIYDALGTPGCWATSTSAWWPSVIHPRRCRNWSIWHAHTSICDRAAIPAPFWTRSTFARRTTSARIFVEHS